MGAGSLLESGPSLLGRGAMKCNRLFRRAERDGATRAVARRPFQAARSVAWNVEMSGTGNGLFERKRVTDQSRVRSISFVVRLLLSLPSVNDYGEKLTAPLEESKPEGRDRQCV